MNKNNSALVIKEVIKEEFSFNEYVVALVGTDMIIGKRVITPIPSTGIILGDPRVIQLRQHPQNGQVGITFGVLIGNPKTLNLPSTQPHFHPCDKGLVNAYIMSTSGIAMP